MSLCKISSILVALLLAMVAFAFALGQDIIFPDQVPEGTDLAKILEIAQKLNDMDSFEEFLNKVEGAPQNKWKDALAPSSSDRGGEELHSPPVLLAGRIGEVEERSKAQIPKPAKCEPELQSVSLKQDNEPSTLYVPSCTRIYRCGGCCSHSLLTCEPTASEIRNFEVTAISVNRGTLRYKSKRIVPLEEHTKCKCDCRIKAEDCNEKQSYLKSECRCACNNMDEEVKCIRSNETKVWNPDRCICLCRDEQECTTGYYFDQNTCRCKQVPLSRTWFQSTKGTDYRFGQTQKPDNIPPVIVPLDATDPRRKPKDDPEY